MHIEIIVLTNSMLHIKKFFLALISSACQIPLLHVDLSLFTLGFFILSLTYLYSSSILWHSPLASLLLSLRLSVLKQIEVVFGA